MWPCCCCSASAILQLRYMLWVVRLSYFIMVTSQNTMKIKILILNNWKRIWLKLGIEKHFYLPKLECGVAGSPVRPCHDDVWRQLKCIVPPRPGEGSTWVQGHVMWDAAAARVWGETLLAAKLSTLYTPVQYLALPGPGSPLFTRGCWPRWPSHLILLLHLSFRIPPGGQGMS